MRQISKPLAWLVFAVAFIPLNAFAHGPTPQKVDETIAISAPPQAVWAVLKDFDGISQWHPLVASSLGKGGNGQDASRDVVLKAGGKLVDGLDEYLDKDMNYSYRLSKEDLDHFPVSFYSATISVTPGANGGSNVEWIGRFYRGDTGNFPPDKLNDDAAIKAMTNFYQQGLAGLKKKVEGK